MAGADFDCRVNGNSMRCAVTHQLGTMTESEEITGTLSGLTMTDTHTKRVEQFGSDGCNFVTSISDPAMLVFSPDGTVVIRKGPSQMEVTYNSKCGNSYTTTIPEEDDSGRRSILPLVGDQLAAAPKSQLDTAVD
ncbi:hypothetical protein PJP10_25080 [Mycobacterium kansasii]